MTLSDKNICRLFLLCTCLFVVFLSQVNASPIELLPADDAQYQFYCNPPTPFSPCPEANLIRGNGLLAYYYYQIFYDHSLTQSYSGIIEFDLSTIGGFFISGQMTATLVLTLKSGSSTEFYLYDMPDKNENGVIELTDVAKGEGLNGGLHEGNPISIDVTQAIEHDLFGQEQTTFSGFILSSNSCSVDGEIGSCQTPKATFYDHTDLINTPKLIISSTATLIHLSSFTATPKSGKVILAWSTESEIDSAGFNIYRSTAEEGEYIKINDALIPAEGSSTQGASYEFIDSGLRNGKTYYYKLEDIDLTGISTFHGPVKAVPRWWYGVRE